MIFFDVLILRLCKISLRRHFFLLLFLSSGITHSILEAIGRLEKKVRPEGYIKLKGRDGYRIRRGNYRIIYEIFDTELVVDIITLGHRKDIY